MILKRSQRVVPTRIADGAIITPFFQVCAKPMELHMPSWPCP
jgi:hypothetical protein